MKQLTEAQLDAIQDWVYDNRCAYPAMSFADGVEALLDVLRGNSTVEELLECEL